MRENDNRSGMITSSSPSKTLNNSGVTHDLGVTLVEDANVVLANSVSTSQSFLDKDKSVTRRRFRKDTKIRHREIVTGRAKNMPKIVNSDMMFERMMRPNDMIFGRRTKRTFSNVVIDKRKYRISSGIKSTQILALT
jgi:hypothetical protein